MLRLTNTDIRKPAPYPKVERKLSTAKEKGWDIVDGYTLRKNVDYIPYPGLQESVCASDCNLIFMCGQATSGKTFTMYFKALGGMDKPNFTARLISVRALDSKKGSSIYRDGVAMCGQFANCEYSSSDVPTFAWPAYNSNLQLIHSNFNYANPSEKKEFEDYAKKVQASLIMIDEATEMNHFGMFAFWFMRNRDNSGMPPQMILSFNPLHEHWTTQMLRDAGYLGDDWFLRGDMIGKVRYFYNKGDKPEEIVWGDTREQVVKEANLTLKPEDEEAGLTVYDYVKSFTVFTGTAADNRELVNATGGQSVSNLRFTGQFAVVGEGYFGPTDNEELTVSRQMIHALFDNPVDGDGSMYATMDISSGEAGNDRMPMLIWRGLRLVAAEVFSGGKMELSGWIDTRLKKYGVPIQNFAFDATGHGYWVQGFSSGVPVTWNARVVQEYDEHGNAVTLDEYFNLRSQLLGKTKVLIERGDMSIALDKDMLLPFGRKGTMRKLIDILFDEMNVFVTTKKNKKTYYRSKDEYKSKFKASPDFMECISLRAYFELDARRKKEAAASITDDAYNGLYRRYGVRGGVRGIGTRVSV